MCRVSDAGRLRDSAAYSAAGVRKPPKEETALGGRRTMPRDRAKSRQTREIPPAAASASARSTSRCRTSASGSYRRLGRPRVRSSRNRYGVPQAAAAWRCAYNNVHPFFRLCGIDDALHQALIYINLVPEYGLALVITLTTPNENFEVAIICASVARGQRNVDTFLCQLLSDPLELLVVRYRDGTGIAEALELARRVID